MCKVIIVTGASNGVGKPACNELTLAGYTVYASMRETKGLNAQRVIDVEAYASRHKIDLRSIDLDISSSESANSAIDRIVSEHGHLDVVVRNAGQIVYGPAEAFTPEQLTELYDANVISTQ